MRDLRELEALVRDPDSRPHFKEAVLAYQAGALRAAVVETWVAVAVDLTNKIRYLADTGDGNAVQAVAGLDDAITRGKILEVQSFERSILDECLTKYELLTFREHTELTRLVTDRHLCAHPAYTQSGVVFSPSAECVRGHLAAAVDCSLSQPPMSGKQLIQNLQAVIDSRSWPEKPAILEFVRQSFLRARPAIKANLVRLCAKCVVQPPDDAMLDHVSPAVARERYHQLLVAVEQLEPDLLSESLGRVVVNWEAGGRLDDVHLRGIVGWLGCFSSLWHAVDPTLEARMVALLNSSDPRDLFEGGVFSGREPVQEAVNSAYRAALNEAVQDYSLLESLVAEAADARRFIPRILEALRESFSYREAERRLELVLRVADSFTVENLKLLSQIAPANPQIYEANRCANLMIQIYDETKSVSGAATVWQDLAKALQESYSAAGGHGRFSFRQLMQHVGVDPTDVALSDKNEDEGEAAHD